jgi:hypothetical protein
MRVATLSTYYHQCSALSALGYLWSLVGWKRDILIAFLWTPGLIKEVVGILEPEHEVDQLDSYLPYCVNLGLVNQSAYSAAKNPKFTVFCHTIGSLVGNLRSINAFYNTSGTLPSILDNAVIVAYIVANMSEFKIHITSDNVNEERAKA